MLRNAIAKYFCVFSLLFLSSCLCVVVPPPKTVPSVGTGGSQWISELTATLMGSLLFDKLFGPKEGGGTKKGILGDRTFADSVMGNVYKTIVQSTEYRSVYYILFVLYLVFFGIKFAIGAAKMTAESLIPIIVRLAIISMFTNPNMYGKTGLPVGWDYYFTFLIEPSLYSMEEFAMNFQAALYGWNVADVSNGFLPIVMTLGLLGDFQTWLRLLSLILTSPLPGFCCFLMVLFTLLMFAIAAFFGIVTFSAILTMLALLFAIGPFFFLLALFDKTRQYFIKWLMHILSFMLQQYALFVVLSIFGFIVSECIRAMLSFDVRCDTVLSLTLALPIPTWLKVLMPYLDQFRLKIPLAEYYVANLYGDSAFVTIFIYALFLYALTQVFLQMMLKMVAVAATLVQGTYSPADNIAQQMGGVTALVEKAATKVGGLVQQAPGAAKSGIGGIVNKLTQSNPNSDKADLKAKDPASKGGGEEGGKMSSVGNLIGGGGSSGEGGGNTSSSTPQPSSGLDDSSELQRKVAELEEENAKLKGQIK